jgi:DNA-binding NarL/FixJ family response regulator
VIGVLIVDDEHLVRGGLKMILEAQPDIDVVGEAGDGARAVSAAKALRPDVILLDVQMPVMNGLDAAREILRLPEVRTRIIMITTFDLDEYVHSAIAAGASGFLLKDTRAEVLADAVRTVAGGEALLAPSILRRLVAHHSASPGTVADPGQVLPGLGQLTERELEVFRLLGRGFSNQEVARELWISESTVKTHVTRVFAKLELRDRAQAVVLAYESGLVTPGDPASSRSSSAGGSPTSIA